MDEQMDIFDFLGVKEEVKPEVKKEIKKEVVKSDKKETKTSEDTTKKYKFPFRIYFAGESRDVSHIFEKDVEYSEKEITSSMLEHQYFEFAGEVKYDYKKEDNLLVAMFMQHKKG